MLATTPMPRYVTNAISSDEVCDICRIFLATVNHTLRPRLPIPWPTPASDPAAITFSRGMCSVDDDALLVVASCRRETSPPWLRRPSDILFSPFGFLAPSRRGWPTERTKLVANAVHDCRNGHGMYRCIDAIERRSTMSRIGRRVCDRVCVRDLFIYVTHNLSRARDMQRIQKHTEADFVCVRGSRITSSTILGLSPHEEPPDDQRCLENGRMHPYQ